MMFEGLQRVGLISIKGFVNRFTSRDKRLGDLPLHPLCIRPASDFIYTFLFLGQGAQAPLTSSPI